MLAMKISKFSSAAMSVSNKPLWKQMLRSSVREVESRGSGYCLQSCPALEKGWTTNFFAIESELL
jgi:hypothetical protein